MNADILETIQATIFGVLRGTPALAEAHILMDDKGDIEARVKKSLGSKTDGPTNKSGLVLIVMRPEVSGANENLPGPMLDITAEIQCIEWVIQNRGANGIGIRSSEAALIALNAIHLYRSGNLFFYPGTKPVAPVDMPQGHVSDVVSLRVTPPGLEGPARCAAPTISVTGSDVTLACATAGADIHYTTDGSFPYPGAPTAVVYAAPFQSEAGTVIRAAAYHESLNPSDAIKATLSED